nr:hypothetical protein [Bradyrhizobium iriomotense]
MHQDLNGDGRIGLPVISGAIIETFGSTAAALYSGNYYLDDLSTGTGPTLKYAGAAVIAANYSTWSVIAAEQVTGGGYDVVWKDSSSGNYSVWSTDSNGNFLTTLAAAPVVLGSDPSLKALEPTLHQDLNGDGTVGAAPLATATPNDSFAFNFTQGASSPTIPSELPDPMPAPADPHTTSEPSTQLAGSHDAAVIDLVMDVLHNLHGSGFLLG